MQTTRYWFIELGCSRRTTSIETQQKPTEHSQQNEDNCAAPPRPDGYTPHSPLHPFHVGRGSMGCKTIRAGNYHASRPTKQLHAVCSERSTNCLLSVSLVVLTRNEMWSCMAKNINSPKATWDSVFPVGKWMLVMRPAVNNGSSGGKRRRLSYKI